MEEIVEWIEKWKGKRKKKVNRKMVEVLEGNKGVKEKKIKKLKKRVKEKMVEKLEEGGDEIKKIWIEKDMGMKVLDIEMENKKGDIKEEEEMDERKWEEKMDLGMEEIEGGKEIIWIGEMGIGKKKIEEEIEIEILGGKDEEWVGKGKG